MVVRPAGLPVGLPVVVGAKAAGAGVGVGEYGCVGGGRLQHSLYLPCPLPIQVP